MAEPRKQIPLRLPLPMAEAIDAARDGTSREQWIRDAIEQRLAFKRPVVNGRIQGRVKKW